MREAPLGDRIAAILDRLPPAERKVAAFVMAHAPAIPGATLAALAHEAGVSEPTVIRFCRSIGLDGFAGLRLAVVRAEATGAPAAPAPIAAGLPAEQAAGAVLERAAATLAEARQGLDGALVARAALQLLRAARVEIWACGASFAAAHHLEARLLGLCRAVAARADGAMQARAAATLDSATAVLCLSRSGAGRDVLAAARLAGGAGAAVLAITRPGSPLAALATLTIPCAVSAEPGPGDAGGVLQLALAEAVATAATLLAAPLPPAQAQRLAAAGQARRIES